MKLIQKIVWVVITCIFILIELCIRIAIFPITLLTLIALQLIGCKDYLRSEEWHAIWNYGAFWIIVDQYHIAQMVSDHLNPNF